MAIPVFPSEKVKPLRQKLGITQGELAAMVGVTKQQITMIETGKRAARGPIAILLGQLAGTSELEVREKLAARA